MAHGRAPLVGESAQQRVQWRSGRALGAALILLLVPALPLQAQQAPGNTSDGTGGEASAGEPLAGEVERGRYVFQAAGCLGCHTDEKGGGAPLAGGRALTTPFGTFYTPNITPDPETGIGARRRTAEHTSELQS